MLWIASRNGRNVLPVKTPIATGLQGWSTISQPAGIPFISSLEAVVNLNEEIANHRADERYEIIQILEELSDTCALTQQRLQITPGLSVTWT